MADAKTLAVYTTEAGRYAALGITPTQSRAIERFLADLPLASCILDLGCGPGLHARAMMDAGHTVDAIDATPAFVSAARDIGVTARLATFDDITATQTYDGIWASFSLLHAPRDDVPRHIAALARALKPGGTLALGMKTGTGQGRDDLGRHYSYFSAVELEEMLRNNALTLTWREDGREPGLSGSVDPFTLIHAKAPHHA